MDFYTYITDLQKNNPKLFRAQKMEISLEEFKRQLHRAYLAGAREDKKSIWEWVFGHKA